MTTLQLCQTVTGKGTFYYIDGKRVSRDSFLAAKFQRRMDSFVTRVERHAVKNFSTVYVAA